MAKFQPPNCNTFRDMNYFLRLLVQSGQTTDRQTESDTYEPIVQFAQVGSKIEYETDCLHEDDELQFMCIGFGVRTIIMSKSNYQQVLFFIFLPDEQEMELP